MDQTSKRRGRPVPDAVNIKHIAFKLEEALAVENTFRPNLLLFENDRTQWEVTLTDRDSAVHVLKLLRVWFDVPRKIFFMSVAYLDLFLTKIKVQQKYLMCLTISCFHVATTNENINIDINQLVSVSQSKCSVKDMLRMADIVKQKLKLNNTTDRLTTCADFLMIFVDILDFMMYQCEAEILTGLLQREVLLTRLEAIVSDNSCSFFRPSTLALVLIQVEVDNFMMQGLPEKSVFYLKEMLHFLAALSKLQQTCQIKSKELVNCYTNVFNSLKRYDNESKVAHSQALDWRFSSSTIAVCNRNRSYYSQLDTIDEQNQNI